MTNPEISVLVAIAAIFTLPGMAFLTFTGLDRRYQALQNGCLAIALSTAFFPVLFYGLREFLPDFQMGQRKLIALLAVFLILTLAVVLRRFLRERRFSFSLQPSDWLALAIFALVVFNRLWMAHLYPFPAWSDSLHHALLTQITAHSGQLPTTLEPFAPINLEVYHLGLYALSGSVEILTGVPSHMALLWTSQFLNALGVIGVFLVLDGKVGRKAALVGSLVVGVFSMQPAWYINWGRFTQVASQAILLVGWFITWEALRAWVQSETLPKFTLAAAAALLNAGIFTLHFRVTGFYLPLLLLSTAWELFQAVRANHARRLLAGFAVMGAFSVLLVLPVLLDSLRAYLQNAAATAAAAAAVANTGRDLSYFQSTRAEDLYLIGLQPWLLVLVGISTLIILARRSGMGILVLLWVVMLWLEGHAYLLNIEVLAFTNYSAIIIMYYLPASLLIGIGVHELFAWFSRLDTPAILQPLLAILLTAAVFSSHIHTQAIERHRHFVTPADLPAMDWIKANTPEDALFAVNTYLWLKTAAHGIDGGYWIPYLTGRQTTASNMLYPYAEKSYQQTILQLSQEVVRQQHGAINLKTLCSYGIDYIYLGANSSPFEAFNPALIAAAPGAQLQYDAGGVKIFKICP